MEFKACESKYILLQNDDCYMQKKWKVIFNEKYTQYLRSNSEKMWDIQYSFLLINSFKWLFIDQFIQIYIESGMLS